MKIYADNAATTKMSRAAIEAMLPYMSEVYGNPSSLHSEGQAAAEALSSARERIAAHLGCTAREIIFTSGGSEADNQAIITAARLGEKKGKKHILYIIRELLDFKPESRCTDVKMAIEYLTNVLKKRCTTFVLSDFIDGGEYANALTIANRKHDVVAIQVYDRRVEELPDVGLMKVRDAETGHEQYIDSSSKAVRRAHHEWWKERQEKMNAAFTKSRVDSVSIRTDEDYVKALLNLFAKRN